MVFTSHSVSRLWWLGFKNQWIISFQQHQSTAFYSLTRYFIALDFILYPLSIPSSCIFFNIFPMVWRKLCPLFEISIRFFQLLRHPRGAAMSIPSEGFHYPKTLVNNSLEERQIWQAQFYYGILAMQPTSAIWGLGAGYYKNIVYVSP